MNFRIVDSLSELGPQEYGLLRFTVTLADFCAPVVQPVLPGYMDSWYLGGATEYYVGMRGDRFACRGFRTDDGNLEWWEPWFRTPYSALTGRLLAQAAAGETGWRWLTAQDLEKQRAVFGAYWRDHLALTAKMIS